MLVVCIMLFLNFARAVGFLLTAAHGAVTSLVPVFYVYIAIFKSQVLICIKTLLTSMHFGKLAGYARSSGDLISVPVQRLYDRLAK